MSIPTRQQLARVRLKRIESSLDSLAFMAEHELFLLDHPEAADCPGHIVAALFGIAQDLDDIEDFWSEARQ